MVWAWYLSVGVATVWLVFPAERVVVVVTRERITRHQVGEALPEASALAGLTPRVDEPFVQITAP